MEIGRFDRMNILQRVWRWDVGMRVVVAVVGVMLGVGIGYCLRIVIFVVQLSAILTESGGRLDMLRRRRGMRKMSSRVWDEEVEMMMTTKMRSVVVLQGQERGLLSTSPS